MDWTAPLAFAVALLVGFGVAIRVSRGFCLFPG